MYLLHLVALWKNVCLSFHADCGVGSGRNMLVLGLYISILIRILHALNISGRSLSTWFEFDFLSALFTGLRLLAVLVKRGLGQIDFLAVATGCALHGG